MSRRLLLLRHGRTAYNHNSRFQGQLDPPLDEVGRRQAAAVAKVIESLSPCALLSSDAQRAVATAEPIAARTGLPVHAHPGLREIYLGGWEGLSRDEVAARFPAEYAEWLSGRDTRRGRGETYAEVAKRAVAVVSPVLADAPPDAVVVAVVHGGTARALLGRLLGLDVRAWWRFAPLGNCCRSMVVEGSRGWRLAEYGVAPPGLDVGAVGAVTATGDEPVT